MLSHTLNNALLFPSPSLKTLAEETGRWRESAILMVIPAILVLAASLGLNKVTANKVVASSAE